MAAAALLLAGCSALPATPAAPAPAAPAAPSAECIVGNWSLDVVDYETQSVSYVATLDAPLEFFSLTGVQNLAVSEDGQFLLQTDISTSVTIAIDGYERIYETHTVGFSTAEWTPGETGTIALADWVDTLEVTGDAPEESGLGGGVGFGAIPIVNMTCEGDNLTLSGLDLPLDSHWTRQN